MGILEEVLAKVDALRRTTGRNVQDMVQQPSLYVEKMTDALRNSNRGVVPVASNDELTNRSRTPSERVEQTMGTLDFGGGLGVIKPKGGNWLSGRHGVEQQLKRLRKLEEPYTHINEQGFTVAPEYGRPMTPEELAAHAGDPATFTNNKAINSFVDRQLTKYIKNDMASPADPIRLLADAWPAEKAEKLAVAEARIAKLRQKQQAQAATRGVPEEYLTQTRQDILKAEESRDLIAENQGLHVNRDVLQQFNPETVLDMREAQGFPAKAIGETPEARMWENFADAQVSPRPAKDFQLPNNLKQDPWLAKVDPNTPVYSAAYDVGRFSHLTDELSNSLREGRLTPEQLGKMPIDQAVRHVAEINALRAVEANKARAMDMADMPIHKDYPTEGMSWRQLKAPDLTPERIKYLESQYPEDNAEFGLHHINSRELQKWLTQEGDAMGHCVGGYCPDVTAGRSNIFSLRDAKGQPHVTIETQPYNYIDALGNGDEAAAELYDQIGERLTGIKSPTSGNMDFNAWAAAVDPIHDDILAEMGKHYAANPPVHPDIVQIKGKGNAKPHEKYLPFIQDFVRSGRWSSIGDAAHTGLSSKEIDQILKGTK